MVKTEILVPLLKPLSILFVTVLYFDGEKVKDGEDEKNDQNEHTQRRARSPVLIVCDLLYQPRRENVGLFIGSATSHTEN